MSKSTTARRRVAAIVAILIAGSTSAALAQLADTTKTKKLEPVVVTEATTARPSAVTLQSTGLPTSVSVIGRDALDRTNVGRDFGTLLRRVPGVMVHNIGQGNTGDSEKMRGFLSSTHGADVAVLIDGVPQNVPSAAINHGMNDMSWLTPDMIDHIEVIKGPFSALFGDQNRSGAINIVTRAAAASSVRATTASYGTRRGALVLSRETGALRSLLVGDKYVTDGYRANSDENRGTVFLKETFTSGSSEWAARANYYKSKWNAPGFLNMTSLITGAVQPTDMDPTAPPLWGDGERSSLVLMRSPLGGAPGFHVSAYGENYKRTRALGANKTDYNIQSDDRRIFGVRAVHDVLFNERTALAVGAETRSDRGNAINQRWPGGAPGPNYTFDQDLRLLTYAAFAQGQYKAADFLKIVGGARYDVFDYDIRNRKLPAASLKYKQPVATPRAGVVVTPFKWLDVFANIGQGFRSPNQTEISPSGNLGPLGASGGTSYPDLKPPKVASKDVGAKWLVTDRWQISAARYHTLNENEITQTAPGVFASVGNTIRDGWEADTRLDLTEAIGVYASYGHIMQARILTAAPGQQDRIPIPKGTAKAGIAYTAVGGFAVNFDASYISRVPYFAGSPLQLIWTRQYSRFDGRISYPYRQLDLTGFVVEQPVRFSAEAASAIASGLFIDTRPKSEVGLSVRWRFAR